MISAVWCIAALLCAPAAAAAPRTPVSATMGPGDENAKISSLSELAIESLRHRSFAARFEGEATLGDEQGRSSYAQFYGAPFYRTQLVSYRSDGLRVYARIDFPPESVQMPASGFPVIVFAHGWVGAAAAARFNFDYSPGAYYADLIDRYVKAGYIVVMPGYRGHGIVKGVPAQGLEFVRVYDNGSYLAPLYYGIDLLHALQAVESIEGWRSDESALPMHIDVHRIYLTGHSQGGDAAFTALVVSSSPALKMHFAAASIWAGCIAGRMEQGAFYGPMETSAAALSDPAYFPHISPSWNAAKYTGSIQDGIDQRRAEMYDTVRAYVSDQSRADLASDSLQAPMAALDAVRFTRYVNVPLDMHYSDSDYFSIPAWNASIVRNVRGAGGHAQAYQYPGNTHEFSTQANWSPVGAVPGREMALQRTLALFR